MLRSVDLNEIASFLEGRLVNYNTSFNGVSIDSRTLANRQLFVALRGKTSDGCSYISSAIKKGAAAVVVDKRIDALSHPQIIVRNTCNALGMLGLFNRLEYKNPVIAVTGSNGKTTIKEMIASILRERGFVLFTKGNLNNHLGVPLTLTRIKRKHQAAVIELGASHLGEIGYIANITRPSIAVLSNAGTAHIGKFGSLDNIIRAKGEIIGAVPDEGSIILNIDDIGFPVWKASIGKRQLLSFSLTDRKADFYASQIVLDSKGYPSFKLHTPLGKRHLKLKILGRYNVANALAAVATASILDYSLDEIILGLSNFTQMKGRGRVFISKLGARIIDDTYNASPTSVYAVIDMLSTLPGRTILVLGQMSELGERSEEFHAEIGSYASGKISAIYSIGPMTKATINTFKGFGKYFFEKTKLTSALYEECLPGNTILVKGSRDFTMENIVSEIEDIQC